MSSLKRPQYVWPGERKSQRKLKLNKSRILQVLPLQAHSRQVSLKSQWPSLSKIIIAEPSKNTQPRKILVAEPQENLSRRAHKRILVAETTKISVTEPAKNLSHRARQKPQSPSTRKYLSLSPQKKNNLVAKPAKNLSHRASKKS